MAESTAEGEHRRRLLERIKELDHLHRNRVRSPWQSGTGLTLSLRFLRMAAGRLAKPTQRGAAVPVPRPPSGMAVTWVGHATAMLSTARSRVLTDPMLANFLLGLRRAEAASLHANDMADVSLVLISHAHHDHLHLPSLRRLPRTATIVVPPRCGNLVEELGFSRMVVLEPGGELEHRDLRVTAVAARHDGSRGFGDFGWRGAVGYVVSGGGTAAFFAGDTAYFSGFEEIGRRHRLQAALLPIAGYEPLALRDAHMSPLDAIYALEDLGAEFLVPIAHGSFTLGYEPLEEPLRWLTDLCAARGLTGRLAALRHGETRLLERDPERVPRPPR